MAHELKRRKLVGTDEKRQIQTWDYWMDPYDIINAPWSVWRVEVDVYEPPKPDPSLSFIKQLEFVRSQRKQKKPMVVAVDGADLQRPLGMFWRMTNGVELYTLETDQFIEQAKKEIEALLSESMSTYVPPTLSSMAYYPSKPKYRKPKRRFNPVPSVMVSMDPLRMMSEALRAGGGGSGGTSAFYKPTLLQ